MEVLCVEPDATVGHASISCCPRRARLVGVFVLMSSVVPRSIGAEWGQSGREAAGHREAGDEEPGGE
jgi:hypothetical protein